MAFIIDQSLRHAGLEVVSGAVTGILLATPAAGRIGRVDSMRSRGLTTRRQLLSLGALLLTACAAGSAHVAAQAQPRPVTIFAAASLKDALDAVTAAITARHGLRVTVSYAASSALARQVEQGAPADILFTADLDWMDWAEARNLLIPGSRVSLLGNALVLIAPVDSKLDIALGPGMPLAERLAGGRLAVARVDAVPAGRYAREALQTLGVWSSVEGRLAEAENVRSALVLVARGEAPLGIVFATDVRTEPRVRVLGTFPATTHKPIVYPAALVRTASPAAAEVLAFLRSAEARAIFAASGFVTSD
jgi:molybdate transport system substrate-binding protein